MPKTYLIAATTLCGRISPVGFSSAEDRRHLESWRDRTDASLIGAGTLRDADPELRGSAGILRPDRIRAVISASGRIPFSGKRLFATHPRPLVFTGASCAQDLLAKSAAKARVVSVPPLSSGTGLDLCAVRNTLQERGVSSLLIEGGGGLNYQALAQHIVDEILLTICPVIRAVPDAASLADGPVPLPPGIRLRLLETRTGSSGELFCRYAVDAGSS